MRHGLTAPRRRCHTLRCETLEAFDGLRRGPPTPVPGTFLTLFLFTLTASGCSMVGGGPDAPEPAPEASGAAADSRRASSASGAREEGKSEIAGAVVETALDAIGTPYEWGGTSANGFDCSGLIRYAYGVHGIDLPRRSEDQLRMGFPVDLRLGALRPGDVLGFSGTPGGKATHVGLYVGKGQFIHSSTNGVRISDLTDPYWQEHFVAARRMVRRDRGMRTPSLTETRW